MNVSLPVLNTLHRDDHLPRKCGSCSACCTVYEITEVEKPMWTPCRHIQPDDGVVMPGDGRCGIYDQRPAACAKYSCLYLNPQSDGLRKIFEDPFTRPDRAGVVFAVGREAIVGHLLKNTPENMASARKIANWMRSYGYPVIIVPDEESNRMLLRPLTTFCDTLPPAKPPPRRFKKRK